MQRRMEHFADGFLVLGQTNGVIGYLGFRFPGA